MELRRELDTVAFLIAVGALTATAAVFAAQRNGAAVLMGAMCLAGLVLGRFAGISGPALLTVALGLAAILWMVWIDPPASNRKTSALAHLAGGALAGWALGLTLRPHFGMQLWPFAALACVVVLTGVWELAEWLGDGVLDTGLNPNVRHSAEDVFFGTCGGIAAIVLVGLVSQRGQRRPERRGDG